MKKQWINQGQDLKFTGEDKSTLTCRIGYEHANKKQKEHFYRLGIQTAFANRYAGNKGTDSQKIDAVRPLYDTFRAGGLHVEKATNGEAKFNLYASLTPEQRKSFTVFHPTIALEQIAEWDKRLNK